jgi:hypothetical protein
VPSHFEKTNEINAISEGTATGGGEIGLELHSSWDRRGAKKKHKAVQKSFSMDKLSLVHRGAVACSAALAKTPVGGNLVGNKRK